MFVLVSTHLSFCAAINNVLTYQGAWKPNLLKCQDGTGMTERNREIITSLPLPHRQKKSRTALVPLEALGEQWSSSIERLGLINKDIFLIQSIPCHVGIHWIALAECSQMGSYVPGFQSSYQLFFFALFVLAKLATSSISRSTRRAVKTVTAAVVL